MKIVRTISREHGDASDLQCHKPPIFGGRDKFVKNHLLSCRRDKNYFLHRNRFLDTGKIHYSMVAHYLRESGLVFTEGYTFYIPFIL